MMMAEVKRMTEEMHKQRLAEATKALDEVQQAMYEVLKPLGFRKHGRVFHRFVDGDVSQVVELQRGQAYREETHLFWVSVGVRVPECQLRTFAPVADGKRFYHEWQCNLRWTVGERSKKQNGSYNLRKPVEPIIADILARLTSAVLPMYYPQLWPMHHLLDSALIAGRRGDIARATELLLAHGCEAEGADFAARYPDAKAEPEACLTALAARFNISLE